MTYLQWALLLLLVSAFQSAYAQTGSRLWATGGVTTIEGSAGGGLVPWALLGSYASDREWGGTLSLGKAKLSDYTLSVVGAGFNWKNRIEVSLAKQTLDLDTLVFTLKNNFGLEQDELSQTIVGAKLRLFGDAIYRPWGQWALGLQYKHLSDFTVPKIIGAKDNQGVDVYVSASKLFLDTLFQRNLLITATLRGTRANQGGLLGFGGDRNEHYQVMPEGSVGLFLTRKWLVGGEFRQKPNNLRFADESDWWDLFLAWVPDRRLAVTLAWVNLGDVATLKHQQGVYLSLQGSF